MAAVLSLRTLHKQEGELRFGFIDASRIPQKPKEVLRYFNILNGAPRATLKEAIVTSFAVIIDNHPRSFPQEGLDKADVVFEVPVEGGATRFLAFFNAGVAVPKIGPVRSGRLYFADIASPLKSVFIHAGGSPQVLSYLRGSNAHVIDVDEIGPEGKYFWRDQARSTPHNLFTSSALLSEAFKAVAQEKETDIVYEDVAWSWREKGEGKSGEQRTSQTGMSEEVTQITIDYSTSTYQVGYRYDPDRSSYIRSQGGKIHENSERLALRVNNLIIVYMLAVVIDEEGRLKIQTIGSGEALVCIYGECRVSLWRKDAPDKQIRFFEDGSPVQFTPEGRTWIHIVPIGRKVVLKK